MWLGNRYATDQGNGPGTAWAPGGSFANQKQSVLERFGTSSTFPAKQRLVDAETRMARLRLKEARLHNQNHGCETVMELHDRGMRFDRLATHDTGLAPHELLDARLPNKNNRF